MGIYNDKCETLAVDVAKYASLIEDKTDEETQGNPLRRSHQVSNMMVLSAIDIVLFRISQPNCLTIVLRISRMIPTSALTNESSSSENHWVACQFKYYTYGINIIGESLKSLQYHEQDHCQR